jgi:integrase
MAITKRFSPEQTALLRGWIQGIAWPVLGELYLSGADRLETQKRVKQLRLQLAIKAKRLNMPDHERIWGHERGYSPIWIESALKSLDSLSRLEPQPKPDSAINDWFMATIANRLNEAGLITLTDLANFINQSGYSWWQSLPNFGAKSATMVEALFKDYADALGLSLDLTKHSQSTLYPVIRTSAITPFERFLPPVSLDGSMGSNRAPIERCKVDATNDYEAITAWLSLWLTRHQTFRAYRKEAERFLLWSIFTQSKSFSSLTTVDCAEYLRFVTNPMPAELWVGQSSDRSSAQWRPFKGPLKPISIRHAKVILSALCDWLVGQRYLDSNPFAGLAPEHYPKRNSAIEKVLSPALWEKVIDYAEKQTNHREHSDSALRYYQRVLFILLLAYRTGLRLDELVKAKTGDLKVIASPGGDQYWLDVVGKGQKHREVPISPSLIDAINRQLYARNLPSIDHTSGHSYLIGKIRGDISEGVSASALARTLKSFFIEAAQALGNNDPAVANRLKKASTHWLRHSHGSHAVARGVPLAIVRDNLGHSDISTTSIYVHTDRDDRYKAMADTTPK